jgi:hypothetical protein
MEVYLSERDIYIPRDKYGISLHCLQYFGQFGQMFTKFKIGTHIHFLEHWNLKQFLIVDINYNLQNGHNLGQFIKVYKQRIWQIC